MFICQFSGKQVGPNISPVQVVVEKRDRIYERKIKDKVFTSYGWEIVREIRVSPDEVENVRKYYNLKGNENE